MRACVRTWAGSPSPHPVQGTCSLGWGCLVNSEASDFIAWATVHLSCPSSTGKELKSSQLSKAPKLAASL